MTGAPPIRFKPWAKPALHVALGGAVGAVAAFVIVLPVLLIVPGGELMDSVSRALPTVLPLGFGVGLAGGGVYRFVLGRVVARASTLAGPLQAGGLTAGLSAIAVMSPYVMPMIADAPGMSLGFLLVLGLVVGGIGAVLAWLSVERVTPPTAGASAA